MEVLDPLGGIGADYLESPVSIAGLMPPVPARSANPSPLRKSRLEPPMARRRSPSLDFPPKSKS
jgi:hypothetical protein